ncbi:MAG: response regulator transcription factor [Defluviitaleaceae bacterium]|nr:response regulator transcription factor [Defluviitaleaceae bacterium]
MINVLVVEDDKNTGKLMCAVLKQHGFAPFLASDGLKALHVIEEVHIDLAVVDVMMPNMDGYELTKNLRSFYKNMPILIVSAKQEQTDKNKGFLAGTDDYMTKPVNEEEFVLRIKALLRRAKIANEKKITIGDVTLDYDSLTVKKNLETINMPQKEFHLLFKLLSYPGTIFTRMQLMDDIWGVETETSDHTLNVHINRIRERFCGWNEFEIVTVRGLGYKAVKNL